MLSMHTSIRADPHVADDWPEAYPIGTMLSMNRSVAQSIAPPVPSSAADRRRLVAMRGRLLARIQRNYVTLTETHSVGPLRLAFTRVENPDTVLDRIVEAEDRREKLTGQRRDGNELHLPYWAELWDSAFGIGACLTELLKPGVLPRTNRVTRNADSQISVLDLGCGMGFAGMVAAAMGARVLFADLEADALLFARLNALRWTEQIRTRKLNWQTDRLAERFDLIIGADVLYDRSQWEFLEPFFLAHLKKDGRVLLGEPGRQTGDLFPAWIGPRGWSLHPRQERVSTRPAPIRIFELKRMASGSAPAG